MAGGWEWLIILAVALLLFGGSRLAGLGKGVGRSIREFKEEVKTVDDGTAAASAAEPVVEAEIVEPDPKSIEDMQREMADRELQARERDLAAREAELRRREGDS
ncbi:MAG: twin-arginine translocase TatA/TatE family subunit [Arachnia sp.]